MPCSACGNRESKSMKHLPLPNGRNGWIELSAWMDYCVPCAENEAITIDESYRKSKESVKNG